MIRRCRCNLQWCICQVTLTSTHNVTSKMQKNETRFALFVLGQQDAKLSFVWVTIAKYHNILWMIYYLALIYWIMTDKMPDQWLCDDVGTHLCTKPKQIKESHYFFYLFLLHKYKLDIWIKKWMSFYLYDINVIL